MPILTITKTYSDGTVLFESDLDNIKDDIENMVNVTKFNDDNIQNAGITGSTKLVDASVSSAKIASAAISTSKIDDSAVTTAKIADANITTAKIADGAVTAAKRAALNYQISSSCGVYFSGSTSYADVTNLSVTITTNGRPVIFKLVPIGGAVSYMAATDGTVSTTQSFRLKALRDATSLGEVEIETETNNAKTWSDVSFFDAPSAGTYTYKLQAVAVINTPNVTLANFRVLAYEL